MAFSCPACGAEYESGSRFCAVCGTALSSSAVATSEARIKCPFCAEEILPDAKKCRHCGEWLVPNHPQPSQPTAAAAVVSSARAEPRQSQHQGLRIASLILGIAGGIIGLFAAGFALTIGGIGNAFGTANASTVVGGSIAALVMSVVGIVGGALALAKPKLAGWLMAIAAVGGTIGVFVAYFVAGPLLLIGSILAFTGSRNHHSRPSPIRVGTAGDVPNRIPPTADATVGETSRCPTCGYVNSRSRVSCKSCRQPLR
jgi:Double zinc ribbon